MGIPRFWFYNDFEWEKGKFLDGGDDEFTRLTVAIRLPFNKTLVIPYKYCDCEDCDVRRGEDNGYRMTFDDTEGDSTFVDYVISIHRYSRNRLPLNEFLRWTPNELHRYLNYGLIPVE